jgi:hypothetical protein
MPVFRLAPVVACSTALHGADAPVLNPDHLVRSILHDTEGRCWVGTLFAEQDGSRTTGSGAFSKILKA